MHSRDLLNREFERRKRAAPRYSLRAFAGSIGLSPGFLSMVLSGRKSLSLETAQKVAGKIGITEHEVDPRSVQKVSLDQFEYIADWYHVTILELACCLDFKDDATWIARKLKITILEARTALARLKRLGLLVREGEKLVSRHQYVRIGSELPSSAVRHHHSQMIEKARRAMEDEDIEERDISGVTVAIDPTQVESIKSEIRRFRRKLMARYGRKDASRVYQMNIQFFALTEVTVAPG